MFSLSILLLSRWITENCTQLTRMKKSVNISKTRTILKQSFGLEENGVPISCDIVYCSLSSSKERYIIKSELVYPMNIPRACNRGLRLRPMTVISTHSKNDLVFLQDKHQIHLIYGKRIFQFCDKRVANSSSSIDQQKCLSYCQWSRKVNPCFH